MKNFGFVTFCRRSSAASAIENVDRAGPLFLKVRFKVEEEEKVEKEERKCEAANFGDKWDFPDLRNKGPEKDFDEEIAEEERMLDEVDRFFKDESSEEWMEMVTAAKPATKESLKPQGLCCARCRSESSTSKCSGCKAVNYCSVVCQRLDWAKHKAVCKRKILEDADLGYQNLVGQSNGQEGHIYQGRERPGNVLGKSDDVHVTNGGCSDMVRSNGSPHGPPVNSTRISSVERKALPVKGVPQVDSRMMASLVNTPQAARSSVSQSLLNKDNVENSLSTSSGSASTGYFMHPEESQAPHGSPWQRIDAAESGFSALSLPSNSEEESIEEESQGMTSMADAMNAPPADIEPFSLEADAHCTVELLTFDPESMVAEIKSIEEGVAEVLESKLEVCGDSPGLEANPPSVGELVAVLGSAGTYIRAKIIGPGLFSMQVSYYPSVILSTMDLWEGE